MTGVERMLDIGTGGGELLASLQPLPNITYATEPWVPNVEVARRALEPLGPKVVKVESEEHLPFESGYFDLAIDRHEEFWPAEVYRILRPGGVFITQQVGGLNTDELNQLLQKKVHGTITHPNPSWSLAKSTSLLRNSGFRIVEELEETYPSYFNDVGAVIYFLKHAPWEIPDFDTKTYRGPLQELHETITREGRLKVTTSRFYIQAVKPA
ncbi:MAG TPA: class I SAM-dependent methyltransferase [Nitrososphaerales archaeon]|nr:class I SAM-dependent methyltransferase [Nitrososphaerales archaeon]